jgi:hypothetical protein
MIAEPCKKKRMICEFPPLLERSVYAMGYLFTVLGEAHLNFNHLKSFYCDAKHKSFTKAAEDLNVSQSTLSLQVKQLEEQFNFLLFRRGKKGIDFEYHAGYPMILSQA